MGWQEDRGELFETVATMVLCAPDRFPHYAFEKVPMTLDRGFDELRQRLERVSAGFGECPTIIACRRMLDEAYAHYAEGRVKEGAWKLQEMQESLWRL
jgi:hypothetical protein